MTRPLPQLLVVLLLACVPPVRGDEPVFSGPQVGETLPPLTVQGVFGELAGQEVDPIQQANGKPVALVFVHARTRPAFGLTNAIMKYAASKVPDGLHSSVIFLTDDPTATQKWMRLVERRFSAEVLHGISPDGAEGPGAYGLNRNVTLTVLVGNEGAVTANFALVQPSLAVDGPKILQAIVDVTGGGEAPSIAALTNRRQGPQGRMRDGARENDPQLTSLLRAVINKRASDADVEKAAAAVEAYVAEHELARQQLGRITNTVVGSDKLSNYGTEAAQKILRRWAKTYGDPTKKQPDDEKSPQSSDSQTGQP